MKKPETKIVEAIITSLRIGRKFYGYHVHGSMMQRGGEPDIDGSVQLYAGDGRVRIVTGYGHLKLEVKTDTGLPDERQIVRLREYHKREYIAGIVTSPLGAELLIQAYEKWWLDSVGYLTLPSFQKYLKLYKIEDVYNIYGSD